MILQNRLPQLRFAAFGACAALFLSAAFVGDLFGQWPKQDLSRALKAVPSEQIGYSSANEWRVFLVSSKDYRKGIGALAYTDADVEDLRLSFIKLGVKPDNIIVMRKSDPDFNMVPTKDNIERQFNLFVGGLTENSVAFCYLSGHGFNVKESGESNPRSYYAPIDAQLELTVPESGKSERGLVAGAIESTSESTPAASDASESQEIALSRVESLRRTSISIDDMLEKLSNSRAKFKWLSVDACCDYLESRAVDGSEFLSVDNIPRGVLFFQSCADGQSSYEGADTRVTAVDNPEGAAANDDKLKHGLFTKSLIEALNIEITRKADGTIQSVSKLSDLEKRTKADSDQDGMITLQEIVSYVQERVDEDAWRYHRAHQNPQVRVNSESGLDDFALFTKLPVEGYDYKIWQAGQTALAEARKLKEDDIYGAHEALAKIPEALWDADSFSSEISEIQTRYYLFVADQDYEKAKREFSEGNIDEARRELELAFNPKVKESDLRSDPKLANALAEELANNSEYNKLADAIDQKLQEMWASNARERAKKDFESAKANLERKRYQIAFDDVSSAIALDETVAELTRSPRVKEYEALKLQIRGAAAENGSVLEDAKPETAEFAYVVRGSGATAGESSIGGSSAALGTSSSAGAGAGAASSNRKPGALRVITINGIDVRFRWCPPGEFMMGSPEGEKYRDGDEQRHKVTITRGFWLAETETSQALWKTVMTGNNSRSQGSALPVEIVTWDECQKFIAAINRNGGDVVFRLPSEAHWEYACRAGSTTAYSFGDNWDSSKANRWNENDVKKSGTKPVGSYDYANAWGLKDMHGNVSEWCQDWYGSYPAGNVVDPTGPKSGDRRVRRGGSWISLVGATRSAQRDSDEPSHRDGTVGFRLEMIEVNR